MPARRPGAGDTVEGVGAGERLDLIDVESA
jgi:hypothetical protein